jgi:hypothetical protein
MQVQRRIEEIQTRVTPELPSSITATLRPYQLSGFHFLAYLTANRFGGVLAVALVWLSLRHMNWSWRHLIPAVRPLQEATS